MATSNIAYRINYSDQGRRGKAGSVDNYFVIAPLQTNAYQPVQYDTAGNQLAPKELSLVFTGYRNPVYGEALWTNMLQLLENFASPTPPLHPQLGQLWFDKTSTLGTLKLCTDPIGPAPATAAAPNPTWSKVNNRIIVSTTSPIPTLASVLDPTLWYNPDNRGLFFWDPSATSVTAASAPYTTLDPTGPTNASGYPTLHPQIGITSGPKWVNVLYHRYASTTEYNTFANQFAAWSMPTPRPTALPAGQQPTDAQWITLIQYVRNYANNHPTLGVNASSLVDTTFRYYSTDRYGFGALQTYYDNLVAVTNAIFTQLSATQNPVPVAAFTPSRTVGAIPMVVTFTDNSVNKTGATYSWNFGDGATSTAAGSTSHTYATAGTFTITLTITTANGTSTTTRSVQAFQAPVAAFTRTPVSGTTPLSVTFNSTTTLYNPTSWSWNFGDGTTSTLQNPSHTYTTAGTYTVTLTATNAAGSSTASSTIVASAPVVTITPVASFTRNVSTGIAPLTVTFTDTSTNAPTSWSWNFGDGTSATTQNATHTYYTPGTYTVTHTVTNSAGSHTTTSSIVATIPAVVPSFTKSPSTGTVPLTVAFTDTSTNSPTSWSWDFGDGATSTSQNPSHTYTTAGTYTVTLNALNAVGGSSTTSTVVVDRSTVMITINSTIQNFNAYNNRISSQHGSAVTVSGTYTAGSDILIIVKNNAIVGSSTITTAAFDVGTGWNASDFIAVGVEAGGKIVGAGGTGNGGAGGLAFKTTRAVSIDNQGTIGGGGGGGGYGEEILGLAYLSKQAMSGRSAGGGGGGGAGYAIGAGGGVSGSTSGPNGVASYASAGNAGTTTAGGLGGAGSIAYLFYHNDYYITGGGGGAGGALGAAGNTGFIGSMRPSVDSISTLTSAGPGGPGGAATSGNANITWVTAGTRLGALG